MEQQHPAGAPAAQPEAPPALNHAPQALPQQVFTEPLEYHQLMRGTARYRWWKPLVGLILAVIYYFVFSLIFALAVMLPYLAISQSPLTEDSMMDLVLPDTQNPTSMLLALGSIILMIPSVLLGIMSVRITPFSRLWSVALKIRWRLLGRTMLMAIVALIIMDGVGSLLEVGFAALSGGAEEESASAIDLDVTAAVWSAILILLLVPFQAAAEELVYRGLFMQTLGAWLGGIRGGSGLRNFLRGPWLVIVIPAIAFGFSHIYDWWGWGAVVAMALAAGWVSWRTGGLEAAISIHVVNNVIAFGFMVFAIGGETGQTESGGGFGSLLGSIIGLGFYCWWVDYTFRRRDGRRTRVDLVESRAVAAPALLPESVAPQAPVA